MACNNDFQGLVSSSSPKSAEEVCETSLMSGLQLHHDLGSSIFSTATKHLDPSENKTTISTVGRPPNSCRFLAIARELRNIIYNDLITLGNIAILRASRQVHDEAKDLLYEHGICRVALEYTTDPKLLNKFTRPPGNKVQNLNILIFLNTLPVDHGPLFMIYKKLGLDDVLSVQRPSDCHITLAYSRSCWGCFPIPPSPVLNFIKSLSTFKLVTLRIHMVNYYHPMDRRNLRAVPQHNNLLQIATEFLSVALGCPERKLDIGHSTRYQMSKYTKTMQAVNPFPNAQYLEFRPCGRPNNADGVHH